MESAFTRGIGEGFDFSVVEVAAPVKDHGADIGALGALGEEQARTGGDEALPPRGAGALVVAERLRGAIAERAFAGHGGRRYAHVTVTVGVAQLSPDHQGAADLVRVADEALYAGKRAGRDRVEARP